MTSLEIGGIVLGSSIMTIVISKLKCYYKHGTDSPCGCGFTESNIADQDEIHIRTHQVNGIDLLYVGKKRTHRDSQEGLVPNQTRYYMQNQ